MKVNMTPNPLDVVTIHASQGDTEARQWEFELHNNGELIDTSEITEQLFFKAYKGGTEQILPENTSTPTTSPFKGDIKYPQGLLSDQEFLYRESPTEEDGLAFVESIKGNTLNWNQLANAGTLSATASYSGYLNIGTFSFVANHKYLIKYHQDNTMASNTRNTLQVRFATVGQTTTENATANAHLSQGDYSWLFNSTYTDTNTIVRLWVVDNDVAVSYSNIMIFDLTQMGLDSITADEFSSLFSLPYYSYNQGTLLSFMGNGIKTVGKNLNPWQGVNYSAVTDRTIFLKKGDYVLSTDNGNAILYNNLIYLCLTDGNGNNVTEGGITSQYLYLNTTKTFYYGGGDRNNVPITLNRDSYVSFGFNNQKPTNFNAVQLEFGSVASNYEPYTSSTLSLPISTYFPTGMKSAGSVYDELTETKAITRIGSVDLGTLTYVREAPASGHPDWPIFYANVPNALGRYGTYGNTQICAKYSNRSSILWQDKTIGFGANSTNINIADTTFTDYTVDQAKQALSGVILYYQLATESETSFTTASLVTENAEIPLSNEYGVLIGKCTEQLSSDSGFIDAKIKLADEDGECYSNKIQLHIERSPQ